MKYIYVTTDSDISLTNRDITRSIGGITDSFLYSLIGGINKASFGCETITKVARKIKTCKAEFFSDGNSFVDSGGYSILTGMVEPSKIPAVIDCYIYYANQEFDNYEYLYSLDIPSSIKYPALNSKKTIYELNKKALRRIVELIEINSKLRSKLYFVWHFKIPAQYEIWCQLYDELELSRYISNYAIGGMVGLHATAKIMFSPFTAISYRCLIDYLKAGNFANEFRLHYLGMYIPYDRFHIAFLEKLFAHYLKNIVNVVMSYDSINIAHTARMNSIKPFYYYEDEELRTFRKVTDAPASIIEKLYEKYDIIYAEIERYRSDDQKLINASSFVPLRVYSNICLDRFFEYLIDRYDLVSLIDSSKSPTSFAGKIHVIIDDIRKSYPEIFSREACRSIAENMDITYRYHKWFVNDRSYQSLDGLIRLFINRIKYPN